MHQNDLLQLLEQLQAHQVTIEGALARLQMPPEVDLGFATSICSTASVAAFPKSSLAKAKRPNGCWASSAN